ncbi:DNA replication and repair protein RecF [termite gut metagenome]|uniref:DNA replication and repair protein RecF n=1 Tax=termite gut metagenome TaxID=433724 RepID=A0A5J4SXP6_9ZZZZ
MIDIITLKNFTNFRNNTFNFCKGINVFIGKNGTGKTHILKCLAATMYAENKVNMGIGEALMRYFKPEALENLIKKGVDKAEVSISHNNKIISYTLIHSKDSAAVCSQIDKEETDANAIYIPPREILSVFEGFLGLIEKREISFDETYISLAKALSVPPLRKDILNPLQSAMSILEQELRFEVVQKHGRFYIKDDTGMTEAHLVAEGMRKLASVMYLLSNGELNKDSILFWDEPESNLNPVLIRVTTLFIMELSRCGVQVFIATHDYLFTSLLSMYTEYKKDTDTLNTKFFSLYKKNDSISTEEEDLMSGLDHNPLLHEHAALYDLGNSLAWKQSITQ